MILAILIMVFLLAWFFFARVTIYETSNDVAFGEDGRVLVKFPKEALRRIRPGQPAILQASIGPEQQVVSVPALVIGTEPGSNQIELLVITDKEVEIPIHEDISGQVQVEVEYVTPATMLRRATGMYLNNSQIPVSPQEVDKISQ